MIDERELRLGNWVLLDTNKVLPSWHQIMSEDIFNIANGKVESLGIVIEPIPLTPEILEKAGFINIPVANDVSYQQLSHDFIDIYTGDKNGICEVVFAIEDHEIRRVRYVHDFQNVFFALANQEINI